LEPADLHAQVRPTLEIEPDTARITLTQVP
jgi:hypothetical protein